jgi:hypothetical protein
MLIDVIAVLGQLVAEMLRHVCGFRGETRHPLNHVHCQMEAIEPVEHHHIEWSRRGTFLDESPHMHAFMIFAPVGQTMNEIRISMIGKDHWPVGSEQPVEFGIADPVWMLVLGLSVIRSTTFTTRNFSSGRCLRSSPTAAIVSSVGTSPAQARSTSHGFDQHQTKRLGPIDREQESVRISEESGLFAVTYLSGEP